MYVQLISAVIVIAAPLVAFVYGYIFATATGWWPVVISIFFAGLCLFNIVGLVLTSLDKEGG